MALHDPRCSAPDKQTQNKHLLWAWERRAVCCCMLNGCVCARCTLLVRGDSGPDSSHDSEVCTRTFPAEGSHRHTKSQSHLGRHTIHPPPRHSAACLPQYCGIRCGMGSTLNTSEWWRWFSQGRKKTWLKGHMEDREQYVSTRGSFFPPNMLWAHVCLTFQINVSIFVHWLP